MNRPQFSDAEKRFLSRMRVARLATADASGQPHVIPIVFVLDTRYLYTPIDEKPKRVGPKQLKRVRNLAANGQVAVIVDRYDEDWTRLAWVLVTGTAELVEEGEVHRAGIGLLESKYNQYDQQTLINRPLIVVTPLEVTSWGAL